MPRPIHTLGDARNAGMKLIAICRNIFCRRRTKVDVEQLIYILGEGRPLLPERGKVHFSEKMHCIECNQYGAILWPEQIDGPEPMLAGLSYSVNEWFGSSVLQKVALVSNVVVAHAAFDAALECYPGRRLSLQQRAFVLRDSRLQVIKGGKK